MKKLLQKTFLSITLLLGLSMNILAQSGANDPTFNTFDNGTFGDGSGFDRSVMTTCIQPDGKIIVGGDFYNYDGFLRNRIARLNIEGSLDSSFNYILGFDSTVRSISIQPDGKIIAAGFFTTYNYIGFNHIARLNSNGTPDNSFNIGTGFDNNVYTTSIQSDGKIIVAGDFTHYNGTLKNRIVRLNSDGSLDASFNIGAGFDGISYTSNIQPDGKIILGGGFTKFNDESRPNVVRLNNNGSLDTSFNIGNGFWGNFWRGCVYSIGTQPDGKIIVGGDFRSYNGILKNCIIRLNSDGSIDTTFNIGTGFNSAYLDCSVNTINIQPDGKILVGGFFNTYNGTSSNYIARLNINGSLDTTFKQGAGIISTIRTTSTQPDGKIIVGGDFSYYNGAAKSGIVRLNSNGKLDADFNPKTGFDSWVSATSIQSNGKIIVGGSFNTFNGVTSNYIARLNGDGSLDTNFNSGTGFNSTIYTTSIQPDGKIIVGGVFSSYNGITINRIARLNNDGTLDPTFNIGTGFNNVVLTISIQTDGKIIVGGDFTNFNGVSRKKIARLNNDGTLDTTFNIGTGFNHCVQSISIQTDGKIIVGGDFDTFNGVTSNSIARLNGDGTLDTTFNMGTGFGSTVTATNIQTNGKILVGGYFTTYNGITRPRIARLNSNGSLDTAFTPQMGLSYSAIDIIVIQSNGKIIIGGSFDTINGLKRKCIARLNSDGSLDMGFNTGTGFNTPVYTASLQSDGKIITGGDFSFFNGIKRAKIARLLNCYSSYVQNVSTCNSYTLNGQTYTTSGTYTQTLVNTAGCDSIITLNLTILNSVNTLTTSACNSYTLNGQTYTTSGTYTQTLVNTAGCDSIITLNLTILNSVNTLTTSACNSYTLNGQTYTTSGTYTQTLVNTAGCDSTITLNLTINKVTDISTSVSGVTITANNNSASYLWLNCDNNFAPISGATGQSFTATSNGNYAVQLTQNGCVDTSACVAITTIGVIENSFLDNLRVYPNPTNGIIHIDFGKEQETLNVSLYTLTGQLLENKSYKTSSFIKFEVNAPSGIYLLKISDSDNQEALIRIMKK